MSGWKVTIWARLTSQFGSRRASVGAVTGTIRRLSGRLQAEDVAELSLGGDDVGGGRDQVEPELLELLLGLGDVGDRAAADLEAGLLPPEDLLAQLHGDLLAPELDVLLGQGPVLLLDGADLGHDLGLELPDGRVGRDPGDDDRCPVGLQAAGVLRGAAEQGLGEAELGVRRVGRREDVGGAVRVQVGDVVRDLEAWHRSPIASAWSR